MNKELRFERKWIYTSSNNLSLINKLIRSSLFFKSNFSKRKVNSIYFDDKNFTSIKENLYGLKNKKKIRIRWYGDENLISEPRLEIKKKIGFITEKNTFKFSIKANLKFPEMLSLEKLKKDIQKKQKYFKELFPVSSTHYERNYFISNNNLIRATIDSNIKSIKLKDYSYISFFKNFSNLTILELKYPVHLDNYVKDKLSKISLRLSKNSKFVNSILEKPISINKI